MEYEVRYDDFIVTKSTENVLTNKCSSISFENTGSDPAVINGNIPLLVGDVREFNNLANEKIMNTFKITFTTSVAPKIVIIRKFSKPLR